VHFMELGASGCVLVWDVDRACIYGRERDWIVMISSVTYSTNTLYSLWLTPYLPSYLRLFHANDPSDANLHTIISGLCVGYTLRNCRLLEPFTHFKG
jgi:hypothetical protein